MINKNHICRIDRFFNLPYQHQIKRVKPLFKNAYFKILDKQLSINQILTDFDSRFFEVKLNETPTITYKPCIKIWLFGDNIRDVYGSSIQYFFETSDAMIYVYNELVNILTDLKTSSFIDLDNIVNILETKYKQK